MAIIEDVPGVEISIHVAGVPAKEHVDPEPDEMPNQCFLSSAYIECVDNQAFSFRYKVDKTYDWGHKDHWLKLNFYLGAKRCKSSVIKESSTRSQPATGEVQKQVEFNASTNKWYSHKFVFNAVEKVDDADKNRVEEDKKIAKDLGVLKVEVWRCTVRPDHGQPSRAQKSGSSNGASGRGLPPIAEKAFKGKEISHGASLDEGEPIENSPSQNPSRQRYLTWKLPEDNGPLAVYVFKYRSREALKKEWIIPRSRSPSPIPDRTAEPKSAVKRECSVELDVASVKSKRKRAKTDEDDDLPVVDLTGL
ncbi:hypothetical protein PG985_016320 [Apiospora marii]|uniref:uncharacterized protein n=1 Tax=Apiospora marii TaxID=335849 RepID=UPI00312E154F